jgi:hypothetical protein
MVDLLDISWWRGYRERLEREFGQQSIVVRRRKFKLSEPLFSSAIIPPDALAVVDLFERALMRILIWAPTQELCAVPKSFSGHVIVANFGDKLGLKGLPIG